MSRVSISTGTGPGSSVSLAPETIRIRDALIEKFLGEPVDAMNQFMAQALQKETDEFRRLGILAARIYILRHRIASVQEFNRNPTLEAIPEITTASLHTGLPGFNETATSDSDGGNQETDIIWSKIKMLEAGEVNGVRFLAGTIIDTKKEDSEKLVSSGRAVHIDEDGNELAISENNAPSADNDISESEFLSEKDDGLPEADNSSDSVESRRAADVDDTPDSKADDIDEASDSKAVDIDDASDSNADDIDNVSESASDDIEKSAADKPDDAKTPSS